MESKHADVFAFAILAFEVFAEEVPFPGQTPTVAALRVQKGERPKIPQNAWQMGLTGELWKLLESCWHQDPKRRPSMKKVVRRWRRFVSHENDRIVADSRTSLTVLSTSHDQLRKTPPALDPSRSRAEDIQPIASESFFLRGYRSQVLMYGSRASETQKKVVLRIILISSSQVLPAHMYYIAVSLCTLGYRCKLWYD